MATERCHICGRLTYDMETHVEACMSRRRNALAGDVERACNLLDSIAHRLRSKNQQIHKDIWDVLMTMEIASRELKRDAEEKDPGSMRCENCGTEVHKAKMADHPCEFLRRAGAAKRAFMLRRSLRRVILRLERENSAEEWLIVGLKGILLSIEDLGRELVLYRNDVRRTK